MSRRERYAPVRLGIVGCGRVAETLHLPALARCPEIEVIAVAEADPARLAMVGHRFNIPHRYADYRSLVDNPGVEAVAVCVPVQHHTGIALAAMDAGKHVFVEKPLALSLDECDQLVEHSQHSPGRTTMGFNLRCHRLLEQVQLIVTRGQLGPIKAIRTTFTSNIRLRMALPNWRRQRSTGGGVLTELAVHHFDLWRFLLGTEVAGILSLTLPSDDTATAVAQLANGALATSVFSETTSESHDVEIFGEAGRVHASVYQFDSLAFYPSDRLVGGIGARLGRLAAQRRDLGAIVRNLRQGGDYVASYSAEWRTFADAIRLGGPVRSTLEDGRQAVRVLLAAMASEASGRPVAISDAPRDLMAAVADRSAGIPPGV